MAGGLSYHLSRFPNELGTFLALVGGEFTDTDMRNFHFLTGQYHLEGLGRLNTIKKKLQTNQPFFKISEIDKSDVDVEIDRTKDNQRILRETLDRMRKEDGEKVLLDAYYRKKIVEYANVFDREKPKMDKQVKANAEKFCAVNNNTLSFESDVLNELLKHPNDVSFEFSPGAPFLHRVPILLLFKGRTLEDIYAALDEDDSLFAKKCAAVMRTRDQNLLRANLHLVREAVDSTFSRCLLNEHRVMNLLVENSELCPGLFVKSLSGRRVFQGSFDPESVSPKPDEHGKYNFNFR